mgnify:FL=1
MPGPIPIRRPFSALFPVLVAAFAAPAQAPAPAEVAPDAPRAVEPPAAMRSIEKDELLRHATFLASEELGGRLTGSPGQEAAAKYIAEHFAELGLEPLGDPVAEGDERDAAGARSFYQRYGIQRTFVTDATRLVVGDLEMADGFAVLGGRETTADVKGKVRFCGFGRTRGSSADVPEDESLEGVIAVVAVKGPRGRVPKEPTVEQKFGLSFGTFGMLGRTSSALAKKGAAAVLFVMHDDPIGLADVLNYLALAPGKDTIEANFPGADPGMGGLGRMAGGGEVPTLVLSVPASKALLGELGVDLDAYVAYVDGDGELPSGRDGTAGALRLVVEHDADATACNVVAVLRGSDPELADEAVVYSAHMDHVGRRIDGDVFNGADDNASGSAGLLAIAGAFARAETRPRRSVVFLSVSGEELGLWGSQYYSDHPTWPLDKIVADVNTDMIGRSGPESGPMEVTVTPSYRHPKYSTLVRDAQRFAAELDMSFSPGDKYYMRSDHFNFARKGIPVVFFCNGEHEDYHQVTDHADKLDGDKMQRIARLAFWTGWHAANADEAPQALGRQEAW